MNDSLPPSEAAGLDSVSGITDTWNADRVSDLIAKIKESADKLAADRTWRGDLKILSRALRELRYAFKVFAPYR